jgi:hypothetical protein
MQDMMIGIGCHLDRWVSGEIVVSGLKPGGSAEEFGLVVGSVLHTVDGIAGWNCRIWFFSPWLPNSCASVEGEWKPFFHL